MIIAGTLDITAPRHTPLVYTIDFADQDLSGATFDMHVRLTPDTPGDPLINLNPASAGSEGLSKVYADGTTTLTIQIDEATMEGLPDAEEVGDDLDLAWDLHITPAGGTKAVWLRGKFTVQAGVTT